MRTVTLSGLLAMMLSASVTHAYAIKRVETPGLSCAQVQNIVRQNGAVILRYPSSRIANYTLYDRYVANRTFCRLGETTDREFVPTRDTNRCPVFVCKLKEPLFDRLFN